MIYDLLPLAALLATAATIYVVKDRRRRRTQVNPARPDIGIREAYEIWTRGVLPHPDGDFAAASPASAEALDELERRTLASPHPRKAVRAAILEKALIALHLEAVAALGEPERAALLKGYEPGMDALLRETLRASTAEWHALRFYTHLKYDDAVPDDWFQHFLRVARPYIREKVRLARAFLLEVDESAGRFAEIYDKLLDGLRREMLDAPPKKRFPPADLT